MQVRFNVRETADSPTYIVVYHQQGDETLAQLIARAKADIAEAGLEIVSVTVP